MAKILLIEDDEILQAEEKMATDIGASSYLVKIKSKSDDVITKVNELL